MKYLILIFASLCLAADVPDSSFKSGTNFVSLQGKTEAVVTASTNSYVLLGWSVSNLNLTVVSPTRQRILFECVSGSVLGGKGFPIQPTLDGLAARQTLLLLKPGTNRFHIERSHRMLWLEVVTSPAQTAFGYDDAKVVENIRRLSEWFSDEKKVRTFDAHHGYPYEPYQVRAIQAR